MNELSEKKLVKGVSPPEDLGFNFGAFFLTPLWLVCHGRVGTGILVFLLNSVVTAFISIVATNPCALPLTGLILIIIIMGYFGDQGNKIAWKNKGYTSREQLQKKQKPWMIAGLIIWILTVIPSMILGICYCVLYG